MVPSLLLASNRYQQTTDWVLALDEMTLAKLPEIPKNATKAQMEALKAKYGK